MNEVHGYYLEDLAVGMSAIYAKTVTEADIVLFAGVSGDINPVHLDEEFASATTFKGRIAHGMLTASFISTVLGTKLPGPGCIYISQNLKFKAPVRIGDTVRGARDRDRGRRGARAESPSARVCQVGETVVIDGEAQLVVPRRPASPGGRVAAARQSPRIRAVSSRETAYPPPRARRYASSPCSPGTPAGHHRLKRAMRLFRHHTEVPVEARGAVVALGNFDGVHRGHQAVIGEAAAHRARARRALRRCITFEPHPREFFQPDQPPFRLTPLRIKAAPAGGASASTTSSCCSFDRALAADERRGLRDRGAGRGARRRPCGGRLRFRLRQGPRAAMPRCSPISAACRASA